MHSHSSDFIIRPLHALADTCHYQTSAIIAPLSAASDLCLYGRRAVVHQQSVFSDVDIPQPREYFRRHHLPSISGDHPQNEHSILFEILCRESARSGFCLTVDTIKRDQLPPDECGLRPAVGRASQPLEKAEYGDHGDQHEPEPDEDEDLLVEKVDGQHALHGVVVNVPELSYLEVTECHSREPEIHMNI